MTYGPAGQLLTATYLGYNETRQYNVLNQLSSADHLGNGRDHFQYSYSPARIMARSRRCRIILRGSR